MRVVLGLEYAGDAFNGWQSQPHGRTVQDVVEAALASVIGQRIGTHCAGRTDSGVHATAQVIHFDSPVRRPMSAWVRGVNRYLPREVAVQWACEVDERFHARFSAYGRRYRYVLLNQSVRPAQLQGRVGWFHVPLDESLMQRAAALLVGRHDFSAFRAAGCQARTPVRLMREAQVARYGRAIVFDFEANGFLHHMVRNLVGCLVYIGKGSHPPDWMASLLASGDRAGAAPTFPPDGLYLCGVSYPAGWPLPGDGRIIATPHILV